MRALGDPDAFPVGRPRGPPGCRRGSGCRTAPAALAGPGRAVAAVAGLRRPAPVGRHRPPGHRLAAGARTRPASRPPDTAPPATDRPEGAIPPMPEPPPPPIPGAGRRTVRYTVHPSPIGPLTLMATGRPPDPPGHGGPGPRHRRARRAAVRDDDAFAEVRGPARRVLRRDPHRLRPAAAARGDRVPAGRVGPAVRHPLRLDHQLRRAGPPGRQPDRRPGPSGWPTGGTRSPSSSRATGSSPATARSAATAAGSTARRRCWTWSGGRTA